jgi:signal transduction histidine kinase
MLLRALLTLYLFLQCASAALVIDGSTEKYSDFTVDYFYDATSSFTPNAIENAAFKPIPSQFALGYREGLAWFRLDIENRSDTEEFVLYFTEPYWSEFTLFRPSADGYRSDSNGLFVPVALRPIQDANPSFRLHIAKGETKSYYIRGKTIASHIGAFELYTEKEFFRPSRITITTFYHFYSGVLFILIILNFFLLVEMREPIYFYYIGYVSAFIVFVSMFSGSYLYLGFPGWQEGLHTVGTVVLTFMALFSGEFLELKTHYPRVARAFRLFWMLFLLFGVLIMLGVPYASLLFNIVSAVFVTLLLVMAFKTWMEGIVKTRYYLIALMIYMPTMGMMILTFNGLLANSDVTRYAFLGGALIEIIFFSLILASRFHIAKYDQIRLQAALLTEKQRHERDLEEKVACQQREITKQNAIMLQQSRHAAMGEMISMIAHQWRQPINIIALAIQKLTILQGLGKLDDETVENTTQIASEQITFMSQTIDDFRNFFKPEQQPSRFLPAEKIDQALHLTGSLLKNRRIILEKHYESTTPLYGYENKLMQVLLNIFKNAADALETTDRDDRKITVSVTDTSKGKIMIAIEDNGGGIPGEIAQRIFEPYFSTKSKNGTGLGLYMSKTIVEEHCHGKLSFENTQDGVKFMIVLPTVKDDMQSFKLS